MSDIPVALDLHNVMGTYYRNGPTSEPTSRHWPFTDLPVLPGYELLGKVHVVRRVGTANATIATESLHGLGDHIPASV